MKKTVIMLAFVVICHTSCKKYYNCSCVRVTQTLTPTSTPTNPTYSTTTTNFVMPVNASNTVKANTACNALAGDNGLINITCSIVN